MLREKMVGMHCSYARLQMDVRELEDPWFYYEMVLTRFLCCFHKNYSGLAIFENLQL